MGSNPAHLEVLPVVAERRHDVHVVEEGDLVERRKTAVVEGTRQHDVLKESEVVVLVHFRQHGLVGDSYHLGDGDVRAGTRVRWQGGRVRVW